MFGNYVWGGKKKKKKKKPSAYQHIERDRSYKGGKIRIKANLVDIGLMNEIVTYIITHKCPSLTTTQLFKFPMTHC